MEELEDVKEFLPSNAQVEDIRFEASDIVIYTSSKEFFLENSQTVKKIVSEIKKRVEIRPSSKLFKQPENAEKQLYQVVDEEKIENVIFQPSLGKIIIRSENPGEIIGEKGKGLEKIKQKTLWSPEVERVPAIKSKIVNRARELTVEDPEFRKKFLHEVGKQIRLEKSAGDEWIRVSSLGGFRQVGRSCILVQTEESNVLMDAGINPSAEPGSPENYPYLNAPELDLQNLDAVVLSHAHMDHCLTPDTPVTLEDGSRKPIGNIEEGDKLKTFNWEKGEVQTGRCLKKKEVKDEEYLNIETNYNSIQASEDHRFFRFDSLEVEEVEAGNLKEGDFIPRRSVEREERSIKMEEPEYKERITLKKEAQEEIRKERKDRNLSQKELSKRIGKGVNFVTGIENTKDSVYKENLEKLVEELDIDFNKFIRRHEIKQTVYPELDQGLAKLVGYFYGDGHRDGNRLRFTDKNKECLKQYSKLIQKLFGYEPVIKPHTDKNKNAWQLEVNNLGIVRFLDINFENIFKNSVENNIPNKIFYGPKNIVEGFISGLFDAEGDVSNQVRIAQAGEETRKRIQSILSSIGVKATIDETRRVSVSSQKQVTKFAERVNLSHPKKREKIEKLVDQDAEQAEKMPLTSADLHTIFEEAGMKGRVSGSPSYSDLPTCLVDWYRRSDDSTATRETVETLVQVLEERIQKLENLDARSELVDTQKKLSTSRKEIAQKSRELDVHYVQVVEEDRYDSENSENVIKYIEREVEAALENTYENLTKLKRLLSMNVEWHRIQQIESEKNEYGYLVDIKVSPNENFIAQDQVVHNCGMIPYLYKMGYDGPLYCTKPTRDLMIMLTLDYIGIAHSEAADAPYDSSAIKKAVKRTITPDYGEVTDITPDMRLTLKNSGHILGSSLVHLHVGEGLHNILYTGDYNYDESEMLRPADTNFKRVETMITESTYGGKNDRQQPREDAQKKFLSKLKQTLSKGGKVIVPVFAVGRSQEILGLLARELDRDYFDYNVYLDGMINDANALHTAYPEFLSKNVQKNIFEEENSPFLKDQLQPIGSGSEREDVFDDDACVILTTSGMLTGGPVLSYLKRLADDPDNAMIFVGYQAAGTLGNKIQQGRSTVKVNGERVDINLDTSTVEGFSAHSDRQQIINFAKNLRSTPNKILCNHGEEKKCFSLASTLHKVLHIDTSAPQNLDVNRLN